MRNIQTSYELITIKVSELCIEIYDLLYTSDIITTNSVRSIMYGLMAGLE